MSFTSAHEAAMLTSMREGKPALEGIKEFFFTLSYSARRQTGKMAKNFASKNGFSVQRGTKTVRASTAKKSETARLALFVKG